MAAGPTQGSSQGVLDSYQFRQTLPLRYIFKWWALHGMHTPHTHRLAPACPWRLGVPPPPSAVALAAALETPSFKWISSPEEVEEQACSTIRFWAPNISPSPSEKGSNTLSWQKEEGQRGGKEKRRMRTSFDLLTLIRQSLCLNYLFFSFMLRKSIRKGKQITCYLFTSLGVSLLDSKRI